jgi:hypothetical protein
MDIATIGKLAIDLGVIPTVALFLILSMYQQNKRLTAMLEQREKQSLETTKLLIIQITELIHSKTNRWSD